MKSTKLQTLTLAVLIFLGISTATADTDHVYLENAGYVLFQVEDAEPTDAWRLYTEIEGYTGNGYFEWTGRNNFLQSDTGKGTVTYHFRIETAGNYELLLRSRIAKGDNNTEANDTWVRLSTGSDVIDEEPLDGWFKVFMNRPDTWTWTSRTSDHGSLRVRQHFTQGDHTLEISGRSYGHAIDKMALYRYADVNFNSLLNNSQPLSSVVRLDGSVIDPNSAEEPEPEPIPEPEIIVVELVNAEPITGELDQINAPICSANTLTVPVSKYGMLNMADQTIASDINELLLTAENQTLLLSYDLELLPTFSEAKLHYTTGSEISNGALSVYLGSHDEWTGNDAAQIPNASVNIADAAGGWEAETQYSTTIDASLLPREGTTLMLSLPTDSDDLSLGNSTILPGLKLTGDDSFCSDWDANVLESIQVPVSTDVSDTESTDVDPATSDSTDTDASTTESMPTTNSTSVGGGASMWFAFLILVGLSRKLRMAIELNKS